MTDSPIPAPAAKRENVWINLILNVALPSILLSKGDDWFGLDSKLVLIIALVFPVAYGIYDFIKRSKVNLFSVIGFVSVLITGAIGLVEGVEQPWYALKEAGVPLLFALAVLISSKTKKPLVRSLLYSPEMFDVPLIEASLDEKQTRAHFDKTIRVVSWWLIGSFVLSAILNYVLAMWIVQSPSGTDAWNDEVGKMTALSWPVIAIPSMAMMMVALMKLVKGIEKCTGHSMEDILHPDMREKVAEKKAPGE